MRAITLFVEDGFPLSRKAAKHVAGAVLDMLEAQKRQGLEIEDPVQVQFYAKASKLLCGVMADDALCLGVFELQQVPGGHRLRPLSEAEFWMIHRDSGTMQ